MKIQIGGVLDIEIDPDTKLQRVIGNTQLIYNEVLDVLVRNGLNYTLEGCNTLGTFGADSRYEHQSCYGLMQRNATDISMAPTPFPFMSGDLIQGFMLYEAHIQILSTYNCSVEKSREDSILTDCMDTIYSFSWLVWLLTMVTVFGVFSLLYKSYFRVHQSSKAKLSKILWNLTSSFLNQGDIEEREWSGRQIGFFVCSFIFFMSTFFCNIMNMELVTVKEPTVIKSYDDITNTPTMKPVFWYDLPGWRFFPQADPDTGAGRLWDKIGHVSRNKCLISIGPDNVIDLLRESARFDRISLLMMSIFIASSRQGSCGLYAKEGICTYLTKDTEQNFNKGYGFAMRGDFIQSPSWRHFERATLHFKESGIIFKHISRLGGKQAEGMVNLHDPVIRQCLSDTIVIHPHVHGEISIGNLRKLFALSIGLVCLALLVLIREFASYFNRESRNSLFI